MNTESTQALFKWGKVVLIVLSLFIAVETIGAIKELRGVNPASNTISVKGEGEAVAIPDVATFSFTVSADDKTVSEAQNQVTKKVDAILSEIKSLGIAERDIKTTDYSVYPKYTYSYKACTSSYCPPGRQIQDGYTSSHNITVTVRKTEDAGKALAVAGENGATNLSGISFTVDDMDEVIQVARAEAIEDAKNKAEALSKALGVKLVRVAGYQDSTNGDYPPMPYYAESLGVDTAKSSVAAPTIPTGENKKIITVTVTYEVR